MICKIPESANHYEFSVKRWGFCWARIVICPLSLFRQCLKYKIIKTRIKKLCTASLTRDSIMPKKLSQWLMTNSHCSSSNLMIAKLIMEILYSRETALDLLRLLWDSPNPNIPWINSHHHHRQLHCQNHGLFENKDTNQSYLYNLKIKILWELTSLFCCF